jgi:hypothetical protein
MQSYLKLRSTTLFDETAVDYPTLGGDLPPSVRLTANGPRHIVRGRHGLFLADMANDVIDHELLAYGVFDDEEAELFERMVPRGSVVLECAANLGPFTPLLARLVGPSGLVHTVEPNPRVVHQLHAQLALNGLDNVVVHEVALGGGDAVGGTHFVAMGSLPSGRRTRAGFWKVGASGGLRIDTGPGASVPTAPTRSTCHGTSASNVATCADAGGRLHQLTRLTSVDALQLAGRVSLLKLDVEGAEAAVLGGANATIARWRPLVYAEEHAIRPRTSDSARLLRSHGYAVFLHSFLPLICRQPKIWATNCTYMERNLIGIPEERMGSGLDTKLRETIERQPRARMERL